MKLDFPRAVMPSLAPGRIAMGVVGDGVLVYDWNLEELIFRSGGGMRGDPDLSPDGRLVGYFDHRDVGVVVEIASGLVVAELGIVRGNFPIRMRNHAVVYQKATIGVYERDLTTGAERLMGNWLPTGIAYLTSTGYVSSDQNLQAQLPMLNSSVAEGIVAGSLPDVAGRPGVSRGLGVRVNGEFREIDPGVNWLDCRVLPGVLATWSPERGVCRLLTGIRSVEDVVDAFKVDQPPPPPPPPNRPEPTMPWTPMMPNRVDIVEQVKNQVPDEWHAMNTRGDMKFIKRLAWTLHQLDPKFGLNGKRGNVNDLSEDALAYKNLTLDNGPEVADVVIGHGSPAARPGWINVTQDSQGWKSDGTQEKDAQGRPVPGAGAAWVQPQPVDGTPVPSPPTPELEQLRAKVKQLEGENRTLNDQARDLNNKIRELERRPAATGGSYEDMAAMSRKAVEEYAQGRLGKEQAEELGNVDHVMPSMTVWHLAWRYLREGYTAEQVIADAKARGDGRVPD